jgi:Kdo2-lipid IVA lauroyltransferase/acyltransferase
VQPRALWLRLLSRLPLPVLYAIAGTLTFLLRHVLRHRVGIARANLRACFPNVPRRVLNALLDRHYRNLGQVAAEFVKGATLSAEELRGRVQLLHRERVQAELAAGRSVMLLAAHQCNWEWSLQAVALGLDVPVDAAYKPLHNRAADAGLLRMRSRFGARLVPAKKLTREVARRRRQLHAVCLMADQMPLSSPTRHWLTFLGRDTAFYPGPAQIARSTGYAVFFVAMSRLRRGHYTMDFIPIAAAGEQFEPAALTERYARQVEAQVLASPEDWVWTHRRWKHARPADGDVAAYRYR